MFILRCPQDCLWAARVAEVIFIFPAEIVMFFLAADRHLCPRDRAIKQHSHDCADDRACDDDRGISPV